MEILADDPTGSYMQSHQMQSIVQPVVEDPPKLGLRIFSNPCIESENGALCSRFLHLGGEIIATDIEKVKSWDGLRARFEQSTRERAGVLYSKGPIQTGAAKKHQWPEGYRFNTPRRFWRAKVMAQDSMGGYEENVVMIVVADAPEDRTAANVELDLKDAVDVASYCTRFNKQLQKQFGEHGGVPGVMVAGAVGCEVIKSSTHQFASPGEAMMIIPYPFADVKKFVFDGSEDFLEVPQAFFHHASWLSSGNEYVCDIQGIEDDEGNVILVDPCIVRAPKASVGDLLTSLAPGITQKENMPQVANDMSADRFEALHPRCSQLCKAFDPHRRCAHGKRHCGLNLSCGLK
jgi:hypothetical protein